jgi:hypothetical protein
MRRARFARAVETAGSVKERVSIREALWFGLRTPETTDEASLSDWRVAGLDHLPILLGVTHLFITVACIAMFTSRGTGLSVDNPLIPAFLALVCDAAAATVLFMRNRLNIASHTVVRGLCVYLAIVGMVWTWFGVAVEDASFIYTISAAPIAMSAVIAMGAVVSVQSPPLIITNMITSTLAAIALSDSPLVPLAVEVFSLALVGYSIAGARGFISAGRRRLNLDAEARKAVNFVDEFENSGRGWFWETNAEGTLSYVSQQLADDFRCEAPDRFRWGGRRTQDARLPSVRALPLL